MGRYDGILITTGLLAIAVLGVDASTRMEILRGDGVALMCVIAAVSLTIAAIRHHTRTTKDTLTAGFAACAERIEGAIAHHGEQTGVRTTERVLQALAKGQVEALLDRDERRSAFMGSGADTGQSRMVW
ncbi:hypothetical protein AB0B89_31090 [Sphaerisporangium sp. NPDC049002]|uniref:hypothetical protein n=1 Tax=Sphaerisporangium sp. NPDC049002 TaxID=3155392 RepID=UPI0033CCD664